jgi:hypothetical protein
VQVASNHLNQGFFVERSTQGTYSAKKILADRNKKAGDSEQRSAEQDTHNGQKNCDGKAPPQNT